mgnify:FL=1
MKIIDKIVKNRGKHPISVYMHVKEKSSQPFKIAHSYINAIIYDIWINLKHHMILLFTCYIHPMFHPSHQAIAYLTSLKYWWNYFVICDLKITCRTVRFLRYYLDQFILKHNVRRSACQSSPFLCKNLKTTWLKYFPIL